MIDLFYGGNLGRALNGLVFLSRGIVYDHDVPVRNPFVGVFVVVGNTQTEGITSQWRKGGGGIIISCYESGPSLTLLRERERARETEWATQLFRHLSNCPPISPPPSPLPPSRRQVSAKNPPAASAHTPCRFQFR
jgi:hypothetical protein